MSPKRIRDSLTVAAAVVLTAVTVVLTNTATQSPAVVEPQAFASTQAPTSVNLVINPSFEGSNRPVIFNEVTVFNNYWPWYCDEPYTPAKCVVPPEWNPYRNEPMGRPEYKPGNVLQEKCDGSSSYMNRVHSGCNSQQLFGYSRVIRAGVFQVVRNVTPGSYTLSAFAQLWVSDSGNACLARSPATNQCLVYGDPFKSDVATPDDKAAMFALIGYDPTCQTYAFADTVIWSRDYGYSDGMYDKWAQMQMPVQVVRDCVTIFAGGHNKYAKPHNNVYIDDMELAVAAQPAATNTPVPTQPPLVCPTQPVCEPQVTIVTATPQIEASPTQQPTPTQIVPNTTTPVPTATATPGLCTTYPCDIIVNKNFRVLVNLNVRSEPVLAQTSYLFCCQPAGTVVFVNKLHIKDSTPNSDVWACFNNCSRWLMGRRLLNNVLNVYMIEEN